MIDGSVIRFYKMIGGIGPTLVALAGRANGNSSPIAIEAA
jgi:hypothetical protein